MSYLDRLRPGRYTSPSGRAFDFLFDDVSRQGGKKASVLEIPEASGAIVQDLGTTATRFDFALYFSGKDYDQTADAFFQALEEPGPGVLSHPRWGDVTVLATSYSQTERFVDGMGQAAFDIAFVLAPATGLAAATSTAAAVASAARKARAAVAAAHEATYRVPVLSDLAELKDKVRKDLKSLRRTLTRVTATITETSQRINAEIASMDADVDALLQSPAAFAKALDSVVAAAASAPASIADKIRSYGALIAELAAGSPATPAQAAVAVCTISLLAGAAIESGTEGNLDSRDAAVAAHDDLVAGFRAAREAIEAAERSGSYTADPEAMAALAQAEAQAAAYLLESSYSLRIERRTTLTGAATPLELAWRFYRDLDRLPELERLNRLQGDRLLIIPAGTEVRYYAN